MMEFRLSEEQEALRAEVAKFAKEKVEPGVIERDEKGEYPTELYQELGKKGWVGMAFLCYNS